MVGVKSWAEQKIDWKEREDGCSRVGERGGWMNDC